MSKYYIYARVSTNKQALLGDSIENQILRCQESLLNQGIKADKVFYDEAVSGSLTERDSWSDLLANLKHETSSVIIIATAQDRLIRNVGEFTDFRKKVTSLGGTFQTLDGIMVPNANINSAATLEKEYSTR